MEHIQGVFHPAGRNQTAQSPVTCSYLLDIDHSIQIW
jgi:hypothetical protein